jgi:NAD(P)-dependent dehydrogenase (short-subunit alcohol dehydrogenase family)
VEEIRKAGGEAIADGADVSNFEQVEAMVAKATKQWGSVDLLVANAGILRDKSFAKMEPDDFRKVIDVHLVGTFNCCKAAWAGMRERNYGRIVITTSSSGLFGNFGQANYGAAKAAMAGLMNVLAEEGRKTNIRVNTISPTAATRMTDELLPPEAKELLKPEAITPAVLYMLGEDAPTRTIMGAGAGSFAVIRILETEGINLPSTEWTPEAIAAHFAEIADPSTARALEGAFQQTQKYVDQAMKRLGISK